MVATLYTGEGATPVHIRNMSHSGALIEGAALPDVGERIKLKRGQLQAIGWIAWRAGCRAGVRLGGAVDVQDWMSRQISAGQERVDAMVSIARGEASAGRPVSPVPAVRLSIEAELCQLRLELAALEADLLKDVIMVATHPEIQTIDVSVQRIGRILEGLRTDR